MAQILANPSLANFLAATETAEPLTIQGQISPLILFLAEVLAATGRAVCTAQAALDPELLPASTPGLPERVYEHLQATGAADAFVRALCTLLAHELADATAADTTDDALYAGLIDALGLVPDPADAPLLSRNDADIVRTELGEWVHDVVTRIRRSVPQLLQQALVSPHPALRRLCDSARRRTLPGFCVHADDAPAVYTQLHLYCFAPPVPFSSSDMYNLYLAY